ncbi:hypothetical protein OEZ85_009706 [Tetradesmus obliquus]|uniref:Peptidase C1A papain C-terminal domain-containing protein n=1 Tax=Tetradesmus obliquus TaxID=3088 RepID=A0ABY8UAD6_TETOB|nr:hypothetical protein OEZ85_009706 [Tetradesmus obliquus]
MNNSRLFLIGLSLLAAAVVTATAEAEAGLAAGTAQRQLQEAPPRSTGLNYKGKGLQTPADNTRRSPAQDQGECSSCVGFAVTAAAEAAINVYKQQDWRDLSLSEADLSFCRLEPRVNCVSGASYDDVITSFRRKDVSTWAARSCYGYEGAAIGNCKRADACPSQLPSGASLAWAYDANALDSMAKVKQRIMLSGGVIASMAMSVDNALGQFRAYGAAGDAVFAPNEDLASAEWTMHAIFCYGWRDNTSNAGDGWWLCKNSWGPSWGLNGSFKISYGAAYIMQPDYTYALEVRESVEQVRQRFVQALSWLPVPGCMHYSPKQPERLLKLADDLTTLALASPVAVALPQVLADLVTGNVGRVRSLSAATRAPFRLCGDSLAQVLKTVTCAERPKQLPDALPWRGCKPTLRSVCEARCTPGAKGRGYRAVCSLNDGSVTWVVTGSCSGSAVSVSGSIVDQAKPELCVTAQSEGGDADQMRLQTCGGSQSSRQLFEYKEGRIQLKAAGTNLCLAVGAASSDNGAKVQTWWCDSAANHRWLKGADGTLRPLHALQMCVDVDGGRHSAGTQLQLWKCKASTAKLFWADFVPYLEGRAGVVSLKSNKNMCLAAPVVGYIKQVELQPCSSSNTRLVYEPDGSIRWEDTQYCLDVFGYGDRDGAGIVSFPCNGFTNQRWWKDADGALRPWHALDYCLDVTLGNISPGTRLQLFKCNRSQAQLFAVDWMLTAPAYVYLGCFRSEASAPVLPDLLSEDLTSSNTTEQCWKLAAGSLASKVQLPEDQRVHPLFGVSGGKCFGGRSLAQATAMGPAPESACAAGNPDVVALYQLVQPGGPIPRGCVTDKKTFLKGRPVEESIAAALRADATMHNASYNIARAFALMKEAKYFAVSGAAKDDWGYTFGAEPTTVVRLNVTIGGSLGCYTPCPDDPAKACGSDGGAAAPRVWFVYEFPA